MKQNFAGQPDGGGALGYAGPLPTLTGKDLMSDVSPQQSTIFRPYPRFVDNCKTKKCMKNLSGKKNFDDDYYYYEEDEYFEDDFVNTPSTPIKAPAKKSGGFSLGNWNLADLFNTAGTIYTESARNKAAKEQAELALQIQAQKAAQAKAEAAAKAAESGSVASKIKAYTTPILVVGVLTIGGIAAYFYFKKKKVN
jgi:hypothetical protein